MIIDKHFWNSTRCRSHLSNNFNSLFSIICNFDRASFVHDPYASIPDCIREYMKTLLSCFDIRKETKFLVWLKIPKYFTSYAQIWSTWSCQYKFSSSDITRYCTYLTLVICITFVWIQVIILGTCLFFIWNNTKFVLSLLIENLFATHQFRKHFPCLPLCHI